MNEAIYINHETGEVYETKAEAMEAYRNGVRIDLYGWSNVLGETVLRGYWAVD